MSSAEDYEKAATIKDVAKKAGVATGTVSRYLNGYNIREPNRINIKNAIKEIGYKENFLAKTFKTKKTLTIGAVIVEFDRYHIAILERLEELFSKNGYNLIICAHANDKSILFDKLRFLLDRYIDGLVYSPIPMKTDILKEYKKRGIPVVLFNEKVPFFTTDFIASKTTNTAYQAVEHLIHLGHRRIGMINGISNSISAKERGKGYFDAHRDNNIEINRELIEEGDWLRNSGYLAAIKILRQKDRPTALFVTNHVMATGALQAIQELKLNIPDDISFISFDDIDTFQIYQPGITAIKQPFEHMAELISETILHRLNGDFTDFPIEAKLPTKLILRGSVRKI